MPTDKQRREAARRKIQHQSQRRTQQATRRRRNSLIGSVVGAVVIIGLVVFFIVTTGNDHSSPTTAGSTPAATPSGSFSNPSTSSSSSTAPVAAYPCTWTKSGTAAKKVTVPPTTTPPKKGTVDVSIKTSRGAMTFALNRTEAPCAVESFVSLARQKYFDDTPCPRSVSKGLSVLQCGDPTGTGSGGPGYSFADELGGKETYTRGVLAMANSGPNTNGSQFFIVDKVSPLPPNYTVFGKVSKGLGVVDKVIAAGDDGSNPAGGGKPKLPINLTKVTVKK